MSRTEDRPTHAGAEGGRRTRHRQGACGWHRREWKGRVPYRLCQDGMQRRRGDTIKCLFRTIQRVHAARRTSTRPRATHNSVGALTIHHPDWMDRHPSGSRQDTHGTLGPFAGRPWVGVAQHTSQSTSPSAPAQKYLKILIRENRFIPREQGKLGSKHTVKFSKGTWHQIKNSGKKRSIARNYPKSVNIMSAVFARQNSGKDHMRKHCTMKDAPREAAWDLARNIYKLKSSDKTTFNTPVEAKVLPALTSKRPEEREFVVDSGASMHMMSKKN